MCDIFIFSPWHKTIHRIRFQTHEYIKHDLGPKSLEVQFVQSQPSRAWKAGTYQFTHGPSLPGSKPQVWSGSLHGNNFWKWNFQTCIESWVEQESRPNFQHMSANRFSLNNHVNHVFNLCRGWKVGTLWDWGPPCEPAIRIKLKHRNHDRFHCQNNYKEESSNHLSPNEKNDHIQSSKSVEIPISCDA